MFFNFGQFILWGSYRSRLWNMVRNLRFFHIWFGWWEKPSWTWSRLTCVIVRAVSWRTLNLLFPCSLVIIFRGHSRRCTFPSTYLWTLWNFLIWSFSRYNFVCRRLFDMFWSNLILACILSSEAWNWIFYTISWIYNAII